MIWQHVNVAVAMYTTHMEQNPEFFRKGYLILQPSFFTLIDEQYYMFVDAMEKFEFETKGIKIESFGNDILFICMPFLVKAKCWVALLIDLVNSEIIVKDCCRPNIPEKLI